VSSKQDRRSRWRELLKRSKRSQQRKSGGDGPVFLGLRVCGFQRSSRNLELRQCGTRLLHDWLERHGWLIQSQRLFSLRHGDALAWAGEGSGGRGQRAWKLATTASGLHRRGSLSARSAGRQRRRRLWIFRINLTIQSGKPSDKKSDRQLGPSPWGRKPHDSRQLRVLIKKDVARHTLTVRDLRELLCTNPSFLDAHMATAGRAWVEDLALRTRASRAAAVPAGRKLSAPQK